MNTISVENQRDYLVDDAYGVHLVENLDDEICNKEENYQCVYLVSAFYDIYESARELYFRKDKFFVLKSLSLLDLLALSQHLVDDCHTKIKMILINYDSYDIALKNLDNFFKKDASINRSLIDLMVSSSRRQQFNSETIISEFLLGLRNYHHMIRRAEDLDSFIQCIQQRFKITIITISEEILDERV